MAKKILIVVVSMILGVGTLYLSIFLFFSLLDWGRTTSAQNLTLVKILLPSSFVIYWLARKMRRAQKARQAKKLSAQ